MGKHRISIVIPVLNEVGNLKKLNDHLKAVARKENLKEIIIVDGGSTDETIEIIKTFEDVQLVKSEKGRAKQLNTGAQHARGEILYFLHADTFPPDGFDEKILNAKASAGCFRLKFDNPDSIWLKIAPWFTQFSNFLFRGGDQSLFILSTTFRELGGFDERYAVYEDVEFIQRIRKKHRFDILDDYVITSARRFRENGSARLYYHFLMVHLKARLGQGPDALYDYYRRHIS